MGPEEIVHPVLKRDAVVDAEESENLLERGIVDAWRGFETKWGKEVPTVAIAVVVFDPEEPRVIVTHLPVEEGIGEIDDVDVRTDTEHRSGLLRGGEVDVFVEDVSVDTRALEVNDDPQLLALLERERGIITGPILQDSGTRIYMKERRFGGPGREELHLPKGLEAIPFLGDARGGLGEGGVIARVERGVEVLVNAPSVFPPM